MTIKAAGQSPPAEGGKRLLPFFQSGQKFELWLAIVLTFAILCLHVVRALKAGALWRDEAAAVQLATLPSFKEVVRYFPHEAFPLLFPSVVRTVNWLGNGGDVAFRVFGALVGVSIVGALWLNSWWFRKGVPLLSLALLGFNGAFLQWGDTMRGYGLGTLFLLLTLGLIWRVVQQPRPARIAAASVGAVVSVQCIFQNPPLLFAICCGAMAVTLRRKAIRSTVLILIIGVVAASSLLPYWGPLHHAREWDTLVRWPTDIATLWTRLSETLGASGWSNIWIWVLLFCLALGVALVNLPGSKNAMMGAETKDLLLFAGTALVMALLGCFCFLWFLSYSPRPWYLLPLLGVTAVLLDTVVDVLRGNWFRTGRVLLVIAMVLTSLPLTLRQAQIRQTSLDLVAVKLRQLATADDLVVVAPWFYGISFQRYYSGPAPLMTVPPTDFLKFHRFDLIKAQMEVGDAKATMEPLLQRIAETLAGGHRVWVVGRLESSIAKTPSGKERIASERERGPELEAAILQWSRQVALQLRQSASHLAQVELGFAGPINRFENVPLSVYEARLGR